ncbi:unnamed protein product [Phytomonas sp. Hart1]|nr:unnamed protein product [Phytomonas sp. Hart1]|eukprot:CCW67756.1 unnamed protein product [Phytomonas sp. isolate Hart1]
MNNVEDDSLNNVLSTFPREPGLEESICNFNLLGSIVDPEGELSTMDDDIYDYSYHNNPMKTLNEEVIPVVGGTNPVEAYLNDLLLSLREYFLYFDGTTKSFRKCPGARHEHSVAEPPDGAEGFSFEWFGIALAIVRDVLGRESKLKKELSTLRPLPITIYQAHENFMAGLNHLTFHVTKDWLRLGYSSNFHESLPPIRSISKRILNNWVVSHQLPDSISSRYPNALSETPIGSLQDLEIVLLADAGAWIASFFPLYHSLSQNACAFTNFIWDRKLIDQFDIEEFAYQIYTLCMQRSLLKNKDGLSRGMIVPKSWLTGLLNWLVHLLHSDEERDLSSIPGPIDAFSCMKVDSHNPSKHWLLHEMKTSVNVIPERLFCLLSQLFGCGIKYASYGNFTLRNEFIGQLKPKGLMIDVSFCWFQTSEGILEEKNVHVFVENALRHTGLSEVIRLAFAILKNEEDSMPADLLRLWAAAVNGPTALIVKAKSLNYEFLSTPLDLSIEAQDLPMSSLIKTLGAKLGGGVRFAPRQKFEIGIELQLRSAEAGPGEPILPVVTPQTLHQCGLCGLTNVGNTCYMNSALQCLSNIPRFRDQMLYFPASHYINAPLVHQVVGLLTEMWSGQKECVKTEAVNRVFGQKVKRFTGYQQQDACEFVEVLLDRMQEEINQVSERCYRERRDDDKHVPLVRLSEIFWNSFLANNTSFISQDFFHQSKTVFSCLTCEETSVVFDNNVTLSLNIRETKTHNVLVVVQKFTCGASGEYFISAPPAQSTARGLEDPVFCVSLEVQVVDGEGGEIAEIALKKAIRHALQDCSELQRKLACKPRTEIQPMGGAHEFDFHIEVLGMPTKSNGRIYAWARCLMPEDTTWNSRVGVTNTNHKADAHPEPLSHSGGYRIWYFLRCDDDDLQTVHDTPIYVEELPFSISNSEHSVFSGKADSAGKKENTKGAVDGMHEDRGTSSRPISAPFSNHILSLSGKIAQSFLVPYFREPQGPFFSSAAMSDDSDDASAFSPLEGPAGEHDSTSLKVMHYSTGKSLAIDINEYSQTDGDDWLEELRIFHTIKVKRRINHKSQTIPQCGPVFMNKIINVSIFLCFKSNCFRVKLPQLTIRSYSEHSNSSYLRLSNHEKDSNSASMCTLYDCLEQSMMPDTLTDDNSWYCPHCKDFREARVQRNVFRVPPCLIISFKAFKMVNTYHADKNNTPVDFPLQFDFLPYLDVESAPLKQDTTYRLRGVVYHSGSLNFGHYTAYAFNESINKWVYFDDSSSYVMDIEKPPANGAYMLFYERTNHAKS